MRDKYQARLYYLYMMSDGIITEKEMDMYYNICMKLRVDKDDIDKIRRKYEKIQKFEISKEIREIVEKHTHKGKYNNYGIILWNLINLGYTIEEKEIVDFLKSYWQVPEDLYLEMMDVIETCLTLDKHKAWVENIDDIEYKGKKLEQIRKDIMLSQKSMELTLFENCF